MNQRLLELDILRGLSILGMVSVITPGDWAQRFKWMNHAEWRGYPLSDMIFPCFLFCVGMSIAISFYKSENQEKNYSILFLKVIKRVILLIFIGLLVNGFPFYDLKNLRIPGVLQRIAICYFIVASIWISLKYGKVKNIELWLFIISIIILTSYYIMLYHIPVPGIGITGHNASNCWPAIIDQKVFGINHLWSHGLTDGKITYDPEGILSSFPASVNVIIGLIIGIFYMQNKNLYKTNLLLSSGLFLFLLGFLFDYLDIIPMIKKIWTSSFTLYSSGFSLLLLAFIKLLLKYFPKSQYVMYPLIIYGANAILAFSISNMLMPVFNITIDNQSIRNIGNNFFKSFIHNEMGSSISFSIAFLILLYMLLHLLYKKRIFLKV